MASVCANVRDSSRVERADDFMAIVNVCSRLGRGDRWMDGQGWGREAEQRRDRSQIPDLPELPAHGPPPLPEGLQSGKG
jgi:hypothetical protein